jgi:hypothetical protein
VLRSPVVAFTLGLLFALGGSARAEQAPREIRRPELVVGTVKDQNGAREVGRDGAEWAFPGGARLIADPGTSLVLLKGSQRLNLGRGVVPAYSVALRSGAVRVRVPNPKKSAIVVAAPRKVIAVVVEGEAVVGAGSHVSVANSHGETSVAVAASRHRPVDPDTLLVVGAEGELRRPLAPPPVSTEGKTVHVSYEGGSVLTGFAWSEVAGAG